MFFGKVLKHEDKPLVYVGMIDGTESFIPVDNFILFASEMLKEASVFYREKKTVDDNDNRMHTSDSKFNYIKCEDDGGELILKIYTQDNDWGVFEDEVWDAWIAIDDVDHPVMCLVKDYVHDSFQGFCDKMKERVR